MIVPSRVNNRFSFLYIWIKYNDELFSLDTFVLVKLHWRMKMATTKSEFEQIFPSFLETFSECQNLGNSPDICWNHTRRIHLTFPETAEEYTRYLLNAALRELMWHLPKPLRRCFNAKWWNDDGDANVKRNSVHEEGLQIVRPCRWSL